MLALTLTQPWASLVDLGEKRVETRSWSTRFEGEIVIHAAKGYPKWAKETCLEEPFYSSLRQGGNYCYPELAIGHGLCVVRIMGCRKTEDIRGQLTGKELAFGDYSDGRYAWFLQYVNRFEKPIPAVGHLGLWQWCE